MQPTWWWWWAIGNVTQSWFELLEAPDKFEPGTPNLVGAVSLLKAIEYMEGVGKEYVEKKHPPTPSHRGGVENLFMKGENDWNEQEFLGSNMRTFYQALEEIERPMIEYCLEEFEKLQKDGVKLLWSKDPNKKIGLFSFLLPSGKHPTQLSQFMASQDICIRCGGQCAQPFHELVWQEGSCRISLRWYNEMGDVERFFSSLCQFLTN